MRFEPGSRGEAQTRYAPWHRYFPGPARLALSIGLVLVLLSCLLGSVSLSVEIELDSPDVTSNGGRAFIVDLGKRINWPFVLESDGPDNPGNSNLVVLLDGQQLGPPHVLHQKIREEGGGAYSHWGESLIFSYPDTSVRSKQSGRIIASPKVISPLLVFGIAYAAGLFFLLGIGLSCWFNRREIYRVSGQASSHVYQRRKIYLLGAAVPTLISASWVLMIPPIWNGTDSSGFLLLQLDFIPHFPPLYPAFMALVLQLFGVTETAIRFVQLVQHFLTILGIAYLAAAFTQPRIVLLVSTFGSVAACLALFANGIFTEGLATPFLLLFFGSLIRMHLRGWQWSVATIAFVSILAAALTRHALIVFVVAFPAYWGLVVLFTRQYLGRNRLQPLVYSCVMCGLVIATTGLVSKLACFSLDKSCISIVGRAGVYRMQDALALVPERDRQVYIQSLQLRASEDKQKAAIAIMMTAAGPWFGVYETIRKDPRFDGENPDALMNAGFWLFATSFDRHSLDQWQNEIAKVMFGANDIGVSRGMVQLALAISAQSVLEIFPKTDSYQTAALKTHVARSDYAALHLLVASSNLVKIIDSVFLPLQSPWRGLMIGISAILGLVALVISRNPFDAALMLAFWISGAVYVLMFTFITVAVPRYVAPFDMTIWIQNAIATTLILREYNKRGQKICTASKPEYKSTETRSRRDGCHLLHKLLG